MVKQRDLVGFSCWKSDDALNHNNHQFAKILLVSVDFFGELIGHFIYVRVGQQPAFGVFD